MTELEPRSLSEITADLYQLRRHSKEIEIAAKQLVLEAVGRLPTLPGLAALTDHGSPPPTGIILLENEFKEEAIVLMSDGIFVIPWVESKSGGRLLALRRREERKILYLELDYIAISKIMGELDKKVVR